MGNLDCRRLAGAIAFAVVALNRGEPVNAVWLVVAAVSVYSIAYRFYSRFIANTVLELDAKRLTPAEKHNDGLDYVPTNKWVVFGHHFAAIAGAGPLVGRCWPRRWVICRVPCGS
jgi:carbon starvation protein